MQDRLYTTNQLAKLFGVVPTTVIDWIEAGKLEAFKTLGGHRRITVKVHPDVALFFVEQEGRRFAELEKRFKLNIDLKDDPQLKQGEMKVITVKKQDITKDVVGAIPGM